jgi:hypothetical protein
MRPLLRNPLVQYNSTDYDVLRTYLVEQFGLYCAYCEQPVTNDSAVEHKVPKAKKKGFPEFSVEWRNVLLACQACNSAKSAAPSKRDLLPRQDDEEWYLATAKLWVWPDRFKDAGDPKYQPADDIYRWIRLEQSAQSQVDLLAVNAVRQTWGAVAPSWATQKETKLWVLPNTNEIDSLPVRDQIPTRKRVQRTISGLNLNYYNRDDLKYNDRRVNNRQTAYESAGAAIGQLFSIYNALNTPADGTPKVELKSMILMIKAVREAALSTGFWSVWFRVFVMALNTPAAGASWYYASKAERLEVLTRTLLFFYPEEKTDGGKPAPIFPGTDVTRLPLDEFS